MICQKINSCKEGKTQKKDTFDEKGICTSKFKIENPSGREYFKIDFEGRVYADRKSDTKCDYGLLLTDETVIYIELKGRDVKKGIDQLMSTINETKMCFDRCNKKARLIISKFPTPKSTRNSKQYKDLKKLVNNDLIIVKNVHTENI